MVVKVDRWEAKDGTLFETKQAAEQHERRQALVEKLEEFFHRSGHLERYDAGEAARLVADNIGWFRTVLDASAGKN